ncbi:hypothetical protein V8E53_014506 [Lactarius tabidus]|jgi:tetratricopeptide (TPR) repeat protein
MRANPAAKNLLGVLSLLPDGLHIKQLTKWNGMFVDIDVTSCLQTLLQCSLIKLIKERYQPHPIVRHFCLNQGTVIPMHKEILEGFYITLALSAYITASPEAYGEMILEVNNTKATILRLLDSNYGDQSRLIKASINLTTFCASIGDYSEKVISQAVEFVQKNCGGINLLIESLQQWGKLYYNANESEKAQEKLQEAEKLCLSDPLVSTQLYGCVLEDLGETYHKLDAFSNAEACYKKALKLHQDSNDIYHQGNSYRGLGYLCQRQGKTNEALTFYENAIQCHEKVNNTFKLARDYADIGRIYMKQNRLIEAESTIQKALKLHKITNAFLEQGHDYINLGDLYLKLNKPEDATVAFERALKLYKSMNYTLGQGYVYRRFGKIYISQGKLNEAESSFKKAIELSTMAKNSYAQGLALSELGHLYKTKGQLHDAREMFEKAIGFHRKAQNSAWEKYDALQRT